MMTHALVAADGQIVGTALPAVVPPPGVVSVAFPQGYAEGDFDALVYQGGALRVDAAARLVLERQWRIARIKAESAERIAAMDWRLDRVREREAAGWATLAEVDGVLVEREVIRRSSDEAEAGVQALIDVKAVRAFEWGAHVSVPPPRRLTHEAFIRLFTDDELTAVRSNELLANWWTRFTLAQHISMADPATVQGIHALAMLGVIGAQRPEQILRGDEVAG